MKRKKNLFANGNSLTHLITKFGKRNPAGIAFLTDGSCIDTWPPIPGGGGY